MIKTKRRVGHIIVPENVLVEPHEFNVATILSWTGKDVRFIPARAIPTPDIHFRGLDWEIKSPLGKSSRTIENNMRLALKQSSNIIIDLRRMKLPENKCIHEIQRQNNLIRGKHRVIVITKAQKIIEL